MLQLIFQHFHDQRILSKAFFIRGKEKVTGIKIALLGNVGKRVRAISCKKKITVSHSMGHAKPLCRSETTFLHFGTGLNVFALPRLVYPSDLPINLSS